MKRRESWSKTVHPPLGIPCRRNMASRSSSSSSSVDASRNLKRRKTRKGTRSCWACKRRKVKCTYASPSDEVCTGCARRCLDCVGQEFAEEDPRPTSKSRLVGDRIGRLENMIQQLAEQVGGQVGGQLAVPSSSSRSTPARSISIPPVPLSVMPSKHQALSQTLLAAYPTSKDIRIICSTGDNLALYPLLAFTAPSHLLEERVAFESDKFWGAFLEAQQQQRQYTADTHPVLVARQMLLLASILQHLHAAGSSSGTSNSNSSRDRYLGELSQPPRALARRLAEAATTLVTAHDRFTTGTVEGLECLWLEAAYHEQVGSLGRSWLACRRAISIVHLMAFRGGRQHGPMAPPRSILRQPDGEAADLRRMWLSLVHRELALCLALEMPPSASYLDGASMSREDSVRADDETSRLEGRHSVAASHLLERMELDPDFGDMDAVHQIRVELAEAASEMPSRWWRTPSLDQYATDDDKSLFGAMMQLRAQIVHSHLLMLSHLPAMLETMCSEPTTGGHPQNYIHNRNRNRNHLQSSRQTCVEASRSLLSRFIHLRSCERTAGHFPLLDHYARQAAATLMLARLLDGRQAGIETTPQHPDSQQHLSDRAMASEAVGRMRPAGGDREEEEEEEMDGCHPGAESSGRGMEDVLPRLMALEAGGAAVFVACRKPGGALVGSRGEVLVEGAPDTLVLHMPLLGIVYIAPQAQYRGTGSRDWPLVSGTVVGFSTVFDHGAGPQGSGGDVEDEEDYEDDEDEYEEDEEEEDEDEASLTRAIDQRRTAQFAPYISYMLRPV